MACYLCPYGSATSPLQVSERTHHACAFARPRGRSPRLPFAGSWASPYGAGVLGDPEVTAGGGGPSRPSLRSAGTSESEHGASLSCLGPPRWPPADGCTTLPTAGVARRAPRRRTKDASGFPRRHRQRPGRTRAPPWLARNAGSLTAQRGSCRKTRSSQMARSQARLRAVRPAALVLCLPRDSPPAAGQGGHSRSEGGEGRDARTPGRVREARGRGPSSPGPPSCSTR